MDDRSKLDVSQDLEFMLSFLPEGWEEKARELGALRRTRKIPNARALLHVLLIHLAEGLSLRETSVWAKRSGIVDVSDVAIMDRLRSAGPWLHWMNQGLMDQCLPDSASLQRLSDYRVRAVDATHVKEPGPTGSNWRLHFAVDLPSLRTTEIYLTDSRGEGTGEGFKRFTVQEGDLFLGDRAYGLANGIGHVKRHGGDVLVRFAWNNLTLWQDKAKHFDLFAHLRSLQGTRAGDWPVLVRDGDLWVEGRVCAVRRSRQAAEEARQKARRKSQKGGTEPKPETLEAAEYVFVFTTVDTNTLSPSQVLEYYRGRWQIELVFKRLKSIIGLGHLRKYDETSAHAWLQGKLFVALLTEALLRYGETFFPWGYPIQRQNEDS